eukprot:COSAG02_NODE_1054_length_14930_cov_2157.848291_17_plen_66_part_00
MMAPSMQQFFGQARGLHNMAVTCGYIPRALAIHASVLFVTLIFTVVAFLIVRIVIGYFVHVLVPV